MQQISDRRRRYAVASIIACLFLGSGCTGKADGDSGLNTGEVSPLEADVPRSWTDAINDTVRLGMSFRVMGNGKGATYDYEYLDNATPRSVNVSLVWTPESAMAESLRVSFYEQGNLVQMPAVEGPSPLSLHVEDVNETLPGFSLLIGPSDSIAVVANMEVQVNLVVLYIPPEANATAAR